MPANRIRFLSVTIVHFYGSPVYFYIPHRDLTGGAQHGVRVVFYFGNTSTTGRRHTTCCTSLHPPSPRHAQPVPFSTQNYKLFSHRRPFGDPCTRFAFSDKYSVKRLQCVLWHKFYSSLTLLQNMLLQHEFYNLWMCRNKRFYTSLKTFQ